MLQVKFISNRHILISSIYSGPGKEKRNKIRDKIWTYFPDKRLYFVESETVVPLVVRRSLFSEGVLFQFRHQAWVTRTINLKQNRSSN